MYALMHMHSLIVYIMIYAHTYLYILKLCTVLLFLSLLFVMCTLENSISNDYWRVWHSILLGYSVLESMFFQIAKYKSEGCRI